MKNQTKSISKFENGTTLSIKWPGTGKSLNQGGIMIQHPDGIKIEIPLIETQPALDKGSPDEK